MHVIMLGIIALSVILTLISKAKDKRKMARQNVRIENLETNQTKIAMEQERQKREIEKHEKRINTLEFKATQAESDIEFQTDRLADLEAALDYALMQRDSSIPGTKTFEKYQARIVTLKNQIHTAESKLNRANHVKSEAERELGA